MEIQVLKHAEAGYTVRIIQGPFEEVHLRCNTHEAAKVLAEEIKLCATSAKCVHLG